MKKQYLGIDIGGTFIKYGIVDEDFNIIKKWKVETKKFENKDLLYDYLFENSGDLEDISEIGISAPGVIDSDSNVKSYAAPKVLEMYGTNVNDEFSRRTKKRVTTINDAKAAGLCEFSIGNASQANSAAFLILGTGTGGCICIGDGIINGIDGIGGEFHHIPNIDPDTKKIERLGDYASVTALIKIYNQKSVDKSAVSGKEIFELFLDDDKTAISAVSEWVTNICVQLLSITVFVNPEVICIGGGVAEQESLIKLIDKKYKEMCHEYFGLEIVSTLIKPCKFKNDANILGAVMNGLKN